MVDPVTGLPGKSEWLPTMRAIKEGLDAWEAEQKRARDFEAKSAAARQQIADRQAWLESKQKAPTLEDLKAKHGPNWGLKAAKDDEEARARKLAIMKDANRQAFEAECKEAGFPLDSPVSPSLAKLIRTA